MGDQILGLVSGEGDQTAGGGELAKLRGITLEQAKESLQTVRTSSGEYEIEPLSGLTRPEAIRFQNTLEAGSVVCRILPPLMEQ